MPCVTPEQEAPLPLCHTTARSLLLWLVWSRYGGFWTFSSSPRDSAGRNHAVGWLESSERHLGAHFRISIDLGPQTASRALPRADSVSRAARIQPRRRERPKSSIIDPNGASKIQTLGRNLRLLKGPAGCRHRALLPRAGAPRGDLEPLDDAGLRRALRMIASSLLYF